MSENLEAELAEAKRMIVTAQRAFDMQDAVDIPGRAGEFNCLQISKAWLELEKRAEAAEQEAERYRGLIREFLNYRFQAKPGDPITKTIAESLEMLGITKETP